ncbi:MAG: hypothetical protein JSU95_05410 [Betaproteobacteria bacterium]|nr:MAG: hypothetical protein JSU95_05410 [Betaproteobacteria bacterium]
MKPRSFSRAAGGTIAEGGQLEIPLSTDIRIRHADAELIRPESVEVEN